jgi:hypothetical protein
MKILLPLTLALLLLMYVYGKLGARREAQRQDAVRRGLCPTCGYDLRASRERCPECGKLIPHGAGYSLYLWKAQLAARDLLEWYRWYYGAPHAYQEVRISEVANADLAFLAECKHELESLGFRFIADLEDCTVRDHRSEQASVYRIMLGADGTVVAAISHCPAADDRAVRLHSELHDGTHVASEGILPGERTPHATHVPGIIYQEFWGVVDVSELVRSHWEMLSDAISERNASAVSHSNLVEIVASQNRLEMIRIAHKKRVGYIDEEEIRALFGGEMNQWQRDVLTQVEIQCEVTEKQAEG